jgi:transposase
MKKVPYGKYTKEFREEAVKLVTEGELSIPETARRLFLPKSTLENWLKKHKEGTLGQVGKNQRPQSEIEQELARVKRELIQAKMERDILKKAAAYFAKESL